MSRRLGWGFAFVLLGLWIWLSALGVPYMFFSRDWPLLIVAAGIAVIWRRLVRRARRRRSSSDVLRDLERGRIDVDRAIDEMRRRG